MSMGGPFTNGIYYPENGNFGGNSGKGGGQVGMPIQQQMQVPFYAQQAPMPVGQFDNTGRLTDSSLLAQQAILGRQPVQYQPLLTPETYQNFYGNQSGALGPNSGIFVPDYRTKLASADSNAGMPFTGATSGDSGSFDPASGSASTNGMGYGSSGLLGSDGTFGGGLGQGIGSMGSQNAAFGVLGATEGLLGYTTPGAVANAVAGAYLDNQLDAINNSFNALSVPSTPGIVSVSDANGNVASFSTPGSVALSDANTFGGIGTSIGIGDTGSTAPGGGGIADTGTVSVDGVSVSNDATIAAQDAANFGSSVDSGGDGRSSKIICTAMNHAYGFGSFRNAIWIAYADKHLTKAHEVGYHALFLPLVDFGFKQGDGKLNMAVRKVLEWGTRHRSTDLRAELRNTKRDTTGRIIRFIFEPLCYSVGKLKGY